MSEREAEVSVLFSGGSDSTLAAALLCTHFKKVHLLTFHHSAMSYTDKSKVNVRRLEEKFGKDKFTYRLIDIEETFQKLYYNRYLHDLRRFGLFLAPATCNVCQLAMHTQTIIYNLKNNIHFACDGYKQEKKHIYIVMAKEGREMIRGLYHEYGIDYDNPVYDILRTDWELYGLGITPRRNVKFPHERLHYEAQHSCFHGILTNAYFLGCYYPLNHEANTRGIEYFMEKVKTAKQYVDDYVSKNHLRTHLLRSY